MPSEPSSELQSLAQRLGFDAADLDANRAGRLSDAQREHFSSRLASMHVTGLVHATLTIGGCVALTLGMVGGAVTSAIGFQQPPPALIGLSLLAGLASAYAYGKSQWKRSPPAPQLARRAEGYVKWSSREGAGWDAGECYVHVGEVRLSVGNQQQALTEGRCYRVYYTRTMDRIAGGTPDKILSAEPLSLQERRRQ